MSGIITGMLSFGQNDQTSFLPGELDIDVNKFMNELQNGLKDVKLFGNNFSDLNLGDVSNGTELEKYLKDFSGMYEKMLKEYKNNSSGKLPNSGSSNSSDWWNSFGGMTDWWDSSSSTNWWNNLPNMKTVPTTYSTSDNSIVTSIAMPSLNSSNSLDDLIGKLLIELVGIGLTEENYDYYSDSFAKGRTFPKNVKVITIHGTSDTTVPPSNADIVAANIGKAELLYNWKAKNQPHAMIIVGSNKNEYRNLVGNFANCVSSGKCSVFKSSDSNAPLNSIVK